jgi:hypothetical protein
MLDKFNEILLKFVASDLSPDYIIDTLKISINDITSYCDKRKDLDLVCFLWSISSDIDLLPRDSSFMNTYQVFINTYQTKKNQFQGI